MTEENKKNLLEYLVGKNRKEQGSNIPLFTQDKVIDKTIQNKIIEEIQKVDTFESLTIVGKIHNQTISNWLLYGFYRPDSTTYKGFVYLVDDEANTVQFINKFTSGADLFPIVAMQQDEDNNFYCLTVDIGKTPRTTRVLLLNNILSSGNLDGNYYVKIRKSYITPKEYTLTFWNAKRIQKVQGEAVFFIFTTINAKTTIVRFTIDIDQGNKWEEFALGELITSCSFDVIIQKLGQATELYLYGLDESLQNTFIEYSLKGDTLKKEKSMNVGLTYSINFSRVASYDINTTYLCLTDVINKKSYIKKVVGNTITQIATFDGSSSPLLNPSINIEKINNVLFYMSLYYNQGSKIDVGIIQNDNLYHYTISNLIDDFGDTYYFNDFLITNNYNLFNIFTPQLPDNTLKMQVVYNENNYNGDPYQNVNSLKPKSGIIKKDGSIVFARNIYNSSVTGNRTTTSIQIPNTMLNNVTLNNNEIFSETKISLNTNSDNISKNVYETLYLNYINTINMVNDNDLQNEIINTEGANRLNLSASNLNDYDNAKATKYRLVYKDGTTSVNSIADSSIEKVDDYIYKYIFSINVNKGIDTLQIISNDETTIYQEIDLKKLQTNYIYTITQRVHIV